MTVQSSPGLMMECVASTDGRGFQSISASRIVKKQTNRNISHKSQIILGMQCNAMIFLINHNSEIKVQQILIRSHEKPGKAC